MYEQIVLLFLKAMCFHPEHFISTQPLLIAPQKPNKKNPTQRYKGRLIMASFILENPYLVAKMKRIPIQLFSVMDPFGCFMRDIENMQRAISFAWGSCTFDISRVWMGFFLKVTLQISTPLHWNYRFRTKVKSYLIMTIRKFTVYRAGKIYQITCWQSGKNVYLSWKWLLKARN